MNRLRTWWTRLSSRTRLHDWETDTKWIEQGADYPRTKYGLQVTLPLRMRLKCKRCGKVTEPFAILDREAHDWFLRQRGCTGRPSDEKTR